MGKRVVLVGKNDTPREVTDGRERLVEEALPVVKLADVGKIGELKEQAIEDPEKRERIVAILDRYARAQKGSARGMIASKAAATVMAVSMLEMLQG
jgi:hypothetical protein